MDGDPVYAVTYPAEFFPVFGSQTFDSSVDAGRGNLNGCVRATSCAFNGQPPHGPAGRTGSDSCGPERVRGLRLLTERRRGLAGEEGSDREPPRDTDVSFFLLANPMRPNGGILARGPEGLTIPILGITFHGATPTNSCNTAGECYETVDVAAQYDGLGGDAPASITNVLAIANAVAGYYYLHGDLQNAKFGDAEFRGRRVTPTTTSFPRGVCPS